MDVIVAPRLLGRLNKIANVKLPAQVLAPNKHLINAVTKEELFCLTTRWYFLSFGSGESDGKVSRAAELLWLPLFLFYFFRCCPFYEFPGWVLGNTSSDQCVKPISLKKKKNKTKKLQRQQRPAPKHNRCWGIKTFPQPKIKDNVHTKKVISVTVWVAFQQVTAGATVVLTS